MCRKKTNQRIVTLFNMGLSVGISVLFGFFMKLLGFPTLIIAGCVSVVSVLAEHYLTLYPLSIIKYITLKDE